MEPFLEKATRQHTRNHNSRFVLRSIYDSGEISRADLARRTELTRTTVSDVVADLMEQGLVEEIGHGPSTRGRSPILLKVVEDSRHLIGINLASGDMHSAIINLRGEVRQRISRPLIKRDGQAVLDQICQQIDELLSLTKSQVLGIGISTPGVVDSTTGVVRRAVNLGWHELRLRQLLEERYLLPVYLLNDSHALALGEYTFGNEIGSSNLVLIKVGEGIGAGIVLNGHLFYGDSYGSGEIGHIVLAENGRQCNCGNFGCLETVASNWALLERAREIATYHPASLLHQIAPGQPLTLEMVRQACEAGDPALRAMIREVGKYLGIAVAYLVGILNIQRILITGEIAQFGDLLFQAVHDEMARRSLPTLAQSTALEVVELNRDTALLGAAAQLLMYELDLGRIIGRRQLSERVVPQPGLQQVA